jgi:hypothetical protein
MAKFSLEMDCPHSIIEIQALDCSLLQNDFERVDLVAPESKLWGRNPSNMEKELIFENVK